MIFVEVYHALWRMLERRRQLYLVLLNAGLFLTGLFEMISFMMTYGFIRGLKLTNGARSGSIGHGVEALLGHAANDLEYALLGGGLVVLGLAAKNALSLVVRYQVTRFLSNLSQRVGMQLFAALATVPYEEAARSGHAALLRRLKSALELLGICFRGATQIVANFAVLFTLLGLLIFVDPLLTGVFAVLFGAVGYLQNRLLGRKLKRLGAEDRRAQLAANAHLTDAFEGLVEARLRDRVAFFQKRYGQALGARMRVNRKLTAWGRIPSSLNELLLVTAIVAAVLMMALRGDSIASAVPTFAVFGFVGMRSVGLVSGMTKAYQGLLVRADRFRRLMRELERLAPHTLGSENTDVPSYLAEEKPLPAGRDGRLQRRIVLQKVSYRYPRTKRPALREVSLTIEKGQFVAFCGPSGSGKSTLVMLLIGLLKPTKGRVKCDNWSVFEHIRAWQRTIGYVGQSSYLSSTTVRENVAFGIPIDEIDDARVWAALDLAAARSFVEDLPEGPRTILAAQGGGLSGGQRQRILIARALYHDPDIVVFDEATAALDNVTEREITDAAIRLSRSKTVICVAHRLTTIEKSDVIFVLDEGRIVSRGTYDELLRESPVFRSMAQSSLAERQAEEAGSLAEPAPERQSRA